MKTLITILFCILLFQPVYSQWQYMFGANNDCFSMTVHGSYLFAGMNVGIYKYDGISWSQVSSVPSTPSCLSSTGSYLIVGTNDLNKGVYTSSNNGSNWVQSSLNNRNVKSLTASGNTVTAGTDTFGVYISTNSGLNWTQTSLNNRTVNCLAVDGSYIYAGTSNAGVYLTTNNGLNWLQTSLGNINVSSLTLLAGKLFAGTGTGVYLTINNGTNWTLTALNNMQVNALTSSGTTIIAGTQQNGVLVSDNNGTTWQSRNEGIGSNTLYGFCLYNNYIYSIFNILDRPIFKRALSDLIGITQISTEVPEGFSLSQNYPNPFNPVTNIEFTVPRSSFVKLAVFDVTGRELETFVSDNLVPGMYKADWDASKYSSGVYFYRMEAEGFNVTKKMLLAK